MFKLLAILLCSLFMTSVWADDLAPLPADQAFQLSMQLDTNNQLIVQWHIAPGYYLYRDQFKFTPTNQVKIGQVVLPTGEQRKDEIHGSYQAYSGLLQVAVPLLSPINQLLDLEISYQGCSSQGFCYAPLKKKLSVDLSRISAPQDLTMHLVAPGKEASKSESSVAQLLAGHHFILILFSFLGLGILLAFTPCILPMIPILSGIIVGQGENISTRKAFSLSLAYVLGMAIAYAAAGVTTALLGNSIQVFLQKPSVLILFGGLFVLLALSLFGLYDLKLPNSWQHRVVKWSNKHEGGTFVGVFFMGGLSILIASPCVSAPLVGVLAYIAHAGDAVLGGAALFALGVGMGIPLLLIGMSAGRLLPKAGSWMNVVKKLFGVLMIGVAVWIIAPVIPHVISQAPESFVVVKNMSELDHQLALAKQQKKQVILDFYADWCKSCLIMDRHVFAKPEIKTALTEFVLLRVDMTKHNQFDSEIQERFNVIAPPTILFFSANGEELHAYQVVGEVNAKEFLADLKQIRNDFCKTNTQYC